MRRSQSTQVQAKESHCRLTSPHGTVTVQRCAVRSPLTGCQVTSRPPDGFSRYSKWLDTFRTALVLPGPLKAVTLLYNFVIYLPVFHDLPCIQRHQYDSLQHLSVVSIILPLHRLQRLPKCSPPPPTPARSSLLYCS